MKIKLKSSPTQTNPDSSRTQEVLEYFRAKPLEDLLTHWKQYDKLLCIERDQYEPGVFPIHHKLSGRPRPYPSKMPWMYQAWCSGEKLIKQVINEKMTEEQRKELQDYADEVGITFNQALIRMINLATKGKSMNQELKNPTIMSEQKQPEKTSQTPVLINNKEKALAAFGNMQGIITAKALDCSKIKITDPSTYEVATNNIKELNDLVKQVEAARIKLKAPFIEAGKMIDEAAGIVSQKGPETVKKLKDEMLLWELAQEKIRKAEQEKKEKEAKALEEKKNSILVYETEATEAINKAATVDELNKVVYVKYIKNFPAPATWTPFEAEAAETKERLKNIGIARLKYLKNPTEETKAEMLETQEIAEQHKAETADNMELKQVQQQSAAVSTPATKSGVGIRRTWAYEVVDHNKVTRDLMVVDDKKVKAFMKVHEETMKDGQVINGIKYFMKETAVLRS